MDEVVNHFPLSELTRSEVALRHGLMNQPNDAQYLEMERLRLTQLEPARIILGVPMHVTSGFRSPDVNRLAMGALHSAHLDGRAADFYPIGMTVERAFRLLCDSTLPFDQLIFECGTWIHIATAKPGRPPRREKLTAERTVGGWSYKLV